MLSWIHTKKDSSFFFLQKNLKKKKKKTYSIFQPESAKYTRWIRLENQYESDGEHKVITNKGGATCNLNNIYMYDHLIQILLERPHL